MYVACVFYLGTKAKAAATPQLKRSFLGKTKESAVGQGLAQMNMLTFQYGHNKYEVLVAQITEKAVSPTPKFELEPLKS
jgi:hypothetical protein